MKKIIDSGLLTTVVRLVIGFIFLSYGIGKIANPGQFVTEIGNYDIVPNFSLNILALILPWVETICGIMLIAGIKIRANAAITSALMLVFIVAVISAMVRGLDINCGCSSTNPQKVGFPKLIENITLFALSIFAVIFPKSWLSLEELK